LSGLVSIGAWNHPSSMPLAGIDIWATRRESVDTRLCVRAVNEILRLLNADCNQPVGVLAIVEGTLMQIRAQVFALEATTPREGFVEGPSEDAERLAAQLLGQINGQ